MTVRLERESTIELRSAMTGNPSSWFARSPPERFWRMRILPQREISGARAPFEDEQRARLQHAMRRPPGDRSRDDTRQLPTRLREQPNQLGGRRLDQADELAAELIEPGHLRNGRDLRRIHCSCLPARRPNLEDLVVLGEIRENLGEPTGSPYESRSRSGPRSARRCQRPAYPRPQAVSTCS